MLLSARTVPLVAMSLAVSVSGCLATVSAAPSYALYPESAGRLPGSQVARLSASLPGGASPMGGSSSFIKAVDGREVSALGEAFELLPGCHVVETERRLLMSNGRVTWSGDLGAHAFVFQMKPGYEYAVVVEMAEGMSGSARLSLYGAEQDPTGKRTGTVASVDPAAAAQACKTAAP